MDKITLLKITKL